MLSETEAPGESICSVARRYEIDPAQMYQWRKKFRTKEETPPVMLPVEVGDERPSPPSGLLPMTTADLSCTGASEERIDIAFKNGRHLFAPMGIDVKQLGRLVATLEKA